MGVALLTLILITCALILTIGLHATYFNVDIKTITLTSSELDEYMNMYKYFGTFTRCLLSMFEMTLANWPPVTRLLVESVSEYFMPICLIHKLTIGFAVVGVINGVMLQETFKVSSQDDLLMVREFKRQQEGLRKKMKALFYALDADEDGEISAEDFEGLRESAEVKAWLAALGIPTDDIETLFHLLDVDGDGSITADELASRIPRLKGPARSSDVLSLRLLFCNTDDNMGMNHVYHSPTATPRVKEAVEN